MTNDVALRLADGDGPVIVLCHSVTDPAPVDPHPVETARRGINLFGIHAASVEAVIGAIERLDGAPVGLVGWAAGGRLAVAVAARRPELVARLALVAAPAPLAADEAPDVELSAVTAKTLLLHGGADAGAGSRHGSWWQRHLPNARLEMTPGLDRRDLLADRWERVLSFLAPGSGGRGKRAAGGPSE